jgi:serine/threonine-protein kinase
MQFDASDLSVLSRLLDEALDLAPEQVEEWLETLPAEQQRFASRLREMLDLHRANAEAGFLANGPRLEGSDASEVLPGDLVGPYRLIRELGHGGMGTVWLAERADGTLKRRVALKLPRMAWGAGLARRMARERDIGAQLEHPNIARLYDAGVDRQGRPYLALEFIEGAPINAWCDTRGLAPRGRLGLFVQVARAVAHAHGRLVIHRDLKPSNVLVSADSSVHLLDFGIAKLLTDETDPQNTVTMTQARVFTPGYASPEQLEGGAVTVASDVYSLGVMLYELLAGVHPYRGKSGALARLEMAILEGDAPPPSQRAPDRATARTLKGDIDAIVRKAMQRKPEDRYATADAFAEDIERYLQGKTVKARPESALYTLRTGIRGHKVGVTAATGVLAAVLVGAASTAWEARRTAQEAERARIATSFVAELFQANARPRPSESEQQGQTIDEGARLIQARFADQPDIQAELYGVVAKIYTDIAAGPLAIDYAKRQVDILEKLGAEPPRRVKAWMLLADAYLKEHRFRDAVESARMALSLSNAGDDRWLESMALLALAQLGGARLQDAQETVMAAMKTIETTKRQESLGVARLLVAHAQLLDIGNRHAESEAFFRRALDIANRLEGPHSTTAVDIRIRHAWQLVRNNLFKEPAAELEQALTELRSRGPTGAIRAAVESAALWPSLCANGGCSSQEALQVLRNSLATVEAGGEAVPPLTRARIELALGVFYAGLTDVRNAKRWLDSSAPVVRRLSDDLGERRTLATSQAELAYVSGEYESAAVYAREALSITLERGDDQTRGASIGWFLLALAISNTYGLEPAEHVLDSAPTNPIQPGDESLGNLFSLVIALTRAQVRLDHGDLNGAFAAMPPDTALQSFGKVDVMTIAAPVKGELLCRSGRFREGLAVLLDIERYSREEQQTPGFDPGLIRIRAFTGLCALSLHDRALAFRMATEARTGLAAQPETGPYFVGPLLELERALKIKGASRAE